MDGPRPLFSVLVATYNHGPFILETLDSVARQTFADYEVVIVNDGSTDDTDVRVQAWKATFDATHLQRVTYLRTPNGGQSAALEHAFALSRGHYICLLDSDDRWLSEKLEELARIVESDPDAGMIVHPLMVIDAFGKQTGGVRPRWAALSSGDLRSEVLRTGRQVAPPTSGVVIRTDVFRSIMPIPTKELKFGSDAYLTFAASLLAPVRAVRRPLAEYRIHPRSHYISTMLSPDGLAQQVKLQQIIARHLGLATVVRRNSLFARNEFATAKFSGTPCERLRAYGRLIFATIADRSFKRHQRLALAAYWTLCMLSPERHFPLLWRQFQFRQGGIRRLSQPPSTPNLA